MKKIISSIATVIAFTALTLFLIGVVVDFNEGYGGFALIISIIFWATFLYKKFKKRKHETEVELMSTNPIPTVTAVTSPLVDTTSTLPLGAKNHLSQKRSTGVAIMWIVNMYIAVSLSAGLFIAVVMSLAAEDIIPSSDPSPEADTFFVPGVLLALYVIVLYVIAIFAIYKSSTKKSPILSAQDSHYLVFWPLILLGFPAFISFFVNLFF